MDATAGPRGSVSAIVECEVNDEVVVEYDEPDLDRFDLCQN
jgi:hypothetical protein